MILADFVFLSMTAGGGRVGGLCLGPNGLGGEKVIPLMFKTTYDMICEGLISHRWSMGELLGQRLRLLSSVPSRSAIMRNEGNVTCVCEIQT